MDGEIIIMNGGVRNLQPKSSLFAINFKTYLKSISNNFLVIKNTVFCAVDCTKIAKFMP
jgi:hypothetical protein